MINRELSGELVARCFAARTESHIAHLMTTSYAQHMALGDFYDGIIDLADAYAEAAQGRSGLLIYPSIKPQDGNGVGELREWIDKNRKACTDVSELQNMLDEIVALCDSTIYKMRFLR